MKVLHFVDYFYQPTQTFIKRYIQKSQEFSDTAVVSFKIADVPDEISKNLHLFEIPNRLYSRKTPLGVLKYLRKMATGISPWHHNMDNIIRQFNPDIIHCHFGNAGILMMEYNNAFKSEVPYITSFYGYDISSQPIAEPKYKSNLLKLLQAGNGFFAEGPALLKKITDFNCPPDKCHVNPLLIPTHNHPLKTTFRKPADAVKFLFVGRFMEKKGLHVFLEAIGQLKNSIPQFSIDIVGNGPLDTRYREIIAKHDIGSQIIWHGMQTHEYILSNMYKYDFLIHPSLTAKDGDSEGGAPTILIEAQAVGLPVIASDHADIPFVMGYDEFLSRENDVDSLIETIKNAINYSDIKRLSGKGVAKAYNQHDLSTNKTYEQLLKQLAG